jgi:hypothetical protein
MVTRHAFVLVGALIGILAASAVAAAPRDAVERSQSLDTDALRDDVRTNRLQIPSHPLDIAPPQRPSSISKKKKQAGPK